MATENDIRAAASQCANALAGIPDALDRLPTTVATVVRPGKFSPIEVLQVIDLATDQITCDLERTRA